MLIDTIDIGFYQVAFYILKDKYRFWEARKLDRIIQILDRWFHPGFTPSLSPAALPFLERDPCQIHFQEAQVWVLPTEDTGRRVESMRGRVGGFLIFLCLTKDFWRRLHLLSCSSSAEQSTSVPGSTQYLGPGNTGSLWSPSALGSIVPPPPNAGIELLSLVFVF